MANFDVYDSIDVDLPGHTYPIIIYRSCISQTKVLQALVTSKQIMIVTNSTVAQLYLEPVRRAFSDRQCDVLVLPDGEEYKNYNSLVTIYDALIEKQHHRDTTLIALGGGVIGDITGFAAATYQRGVDWIQIPTTLLAQIDASIGGKTAVNHANGKNLIGAFYQPQAVLIDLSTLDTLPVREFRAGLGEMIKYALLLGNDFFMEFTEAAHQGLDNKSTALPKLVAACCRYKAQIVVSDEREQGSRALLNLGHTFAHALEAITEYKYWLHGEAVAIGLYCASLLSYNMGILKEHWLDQVKKLIINLGLPFQIPSFIDLDRLFEIMKLDKKIKDNRLRFIVMKEPGECYLDDQVTEHCLRQTLAKAVEGEYS